MSVIEELEWGESGLLPAVVQDAATGEVLTVAYVNRESLRRTLELGETVFYSRSRGALWHKGETSGHSQEVVSLMADCDRDAVVIRVHPKGPACHTGARSCFFLAVEGAPDAPPADHDLGPIMSAFCWWIRARFTTGFCPVSRARSEQRSDKARAGPPSRLSGWSCARRRARFCASLRPRRPTPTRLPRWGPWARGLRTLTASARSSRTRLLRDGRRLRAGLLRTFVMTFVTTELDDGFA